MAFLVFLSTNEWASTWATVGVLFDEEMSRTIIGLVWFGRYKTRDDFVADVRLMFANCVTFNEDDSPVGKAGHGLRTFFDARWQELTASSSSSSPPLE